MFSTDVEQSAEVIYLLYKSRFQIEFIFRDSKQFTGLADCQARDAKKLDFHFNASLSTLNLAKLLARQQQVSSHSFVFSMASLKRQAFNQHLLEHFISNLDLDPSSIKSRPNYESLRSYGMITA